MTSSLSAAEICTGGWPSPHFRFTDRDVGYPPAIRWFELHGGEPGARSAGRADWEAAFAAERENAMARLASTARTEGWGAR